MALQFKVQIKGITQPPVWRRLLVPEQFSFLQMHEVIQAAFDWKGYHLFQFGAWGDGDVIGIMSEDDRLLGMEKLDARKIKLSDVFGDPGEKLVYIYDFGDNWHHIITLEAITNQAIKKADCLDGKSAAPPEDCGGYPGYKDLKTALRFVNHRDHESMREWLGLKKNETWNVNAFDLEAVKKAVAQV